MLNQIIGPSAPRMLAALMTMLCVMATASSSEHCKKVYIEVTNNTGSKVKVIDLDYYDYGKGKKGGWRSEPTKNEVIGKGLRYQTTRRLERVNAEKTKIRIRYRKPAKSGPAKFGIKVHKSRSSPEKTCKHGEKFIFNLK